MICIIGAMAKETNGLIERMSVSSVLDERSTGVLNSAPFNATIGRINYHELLVITCGIGSVAASCALTWAISKFDIKLVINIGVAGGLIGQKVLSVAMPSKVVQHTMDTTAFGDALGYLSDVNAIFLETDEKVRKSIQKTLNLEDDKCILASGDKFVGDEAEKDFLYKTFNATCVDMEGGAIVHACKIFNVPCVILRTISDSGEHVMDYREFCELAANQSVDILISWLNSASIVLPK